eukprot:TRINITY_DN19259_c0_g1_i1.p1 TRINITY_DN19259_c0_g1~~TRINITY_DN19259_c0_g1_i1.p1  ORF type:complete len:468 (-),score=80.87 TRINITY_DN19259_c0_g1_i1:74-1477(-)
MSLREEHLATAVRFLLSAAVVKFSTEEKRFFLLDRGLSSTEASEALRRADAFVVGNRVAAALRKQYMQAAAGASWHRHSPLPAGGGIVAHRPWTWQRLWLALLRFFKSFPRAWCIVGLVLGTAIALLLRRWWRWRWRRLTLLPGRLRHQSCFLPASEKHSPGQTTTAGSDGCTSSTISPSAFETLIARLHEQLRASRELTLSSRKAVENQQRLHQVAAGEFKRKVYDALAQTVASKKDLELSTASLECFRNLVRPSGGGECKVGAEDPIVGEQASDRLECLINRVLSGATSVQQSKRSLRVLAAIVRNVLAHPAEKRFRVVNVRSGVFGEAFENSSDGDAVQILELAGFRCRPEAGTLVRSATENSSGADRVKTSINDALQDLEGRWVLARRRATEQPTLPSTFPPADSPNGVGMPEVKRDCADNAGTQTARTVNDVVASGGDTLKKQPWLSSVVQKQLSRVSADNS